MAEEPIPHRAVVERKRLPWISGSGWCRSLQDDLAPAGAMDCDGRELMQLAGFARMFVNVFAPIEFLVRLRRR